MHGSFALVLAIVFVATLVRSAFGFGEALIAVPLLALVMPVRVAAPLAVLLSIAVAMIVVVQDWREIHLRSAAGLLAATAGGIPLGLFVLKRVDARWTQAGLGGLIVLFATYSLLSRGPRQLRGNGRAPMLLTGFVAGILGGAYGMNGPPLAIYGSLRGWTPQQFRATLQAYFLPASMLGMAGFWAAGLWTRQVTQDFWFSAPAMLPAVFLGRALNRRLKGGDFLRYVYVGLLVIGGVLVVKSIAGIV